MGALVELPIFPLNTVLFPGGPLPLRIFEPRYLDMVRRCLRERSSFGVVLIRAGAEVGSVAHTASVGTSARIVDFDTLEGGLLGLTCRGERRFRLVRRWQARDGLNMGEIEWLPQAADVGVPEGLRPLSRIVEAVLPQLGEIYEAIDKKPEEADWVGARLAELLPLSLEDKQALLEMDDPVARLERIAPLVRRDDAPE